MESRENKKDNHCIKILLTRDNCKLPDTPWWCWWWQCCCPWWGWWWGCCLGLPLCPLSSPPPPHPPRCPWHRLRSVCLGLWEDPREVRRSVRYSSIYTIKKRISRYRTTCKKIILFNPQRDNDNGKTEHRVIEQVCLSSIVSVWLHPLTHLLLPYEGGSIVVINVIVDLGVVEALAIPQPLLQVTYLVLQVFGQCHTPRAHAFRFT